MANFPFSSFLIAVLIWISVAVELISCGPQLGPRAFDELEKLEQQHRVYQDAKRIVRSRKAVLSIIAFVEARDDLQQKGKTKLLNRGQKETLRNSWQALLDHFLALESVRNYHSQFLRVDDKQTRSESFVISYAALLAQYATALRFIAFAEANKDLDKLLNEPVAELGLEAGMYDQFKLKFLNVVVASQYSSLHRIDKHYKRPDLLDLRIGIKADRKVIKWMAKGKGIELTMKNAWDIIAKLGKTTFFPIQAGVSEWLGDSRTHGGEHFLVSPEQIVELQGLLRPGDILIERREWYLSNIGLPGFWPHVALYVGTPEERLAYFAGDTRVTEWLEAQDEHPDNLEHQLQLLFPDQYALHLEQDHGHPMRLIEAMSEGVVHTTLEHSADCDSLAVLRPRLSGPDKVRAIIKAFGFAGRPYDFDFDFVTDSELVCTELVSKAYSPEGSGSGLQFPVVNMAGHKVVPANKVVQQFDQQYGTQQQQTDLVIFFDGHKRKRSATSGTLGTFRASWKRPKWTVKAVSK
jgi:hypothetical protein